MKHKVAFAFLIIVILLAWLYYYSIPSKEYKGELIKFNSAVVVNGSIFTNGTWQYVGKVYLPKGYVAGPFHVQ